MRSREWRRSKTQSKHISRLKEFFNSGYAWICSAGNPRGWKRAESWKEYKEDSRFAQMLKNTGTIYGKGVGIRLDEKNEDLKEKRRAKKEMEEEILEDKLCGTCDFYAEWCHNCPYK